MSLLPYCVDVAFSRYPFLEALASSLTMFTDTCLVLEAAFLVYLLLVPPAGGKATFAYMATCVVLLRSAPCIRY